MATFTRGDLAPVAFRTPNQFFNVTGWNSDNSILLFDVTNTSHGGAGTARIAGKPDFKGTMNYSFDLDNALFGNNFSVLPGTSGIMFWYIGNTNVPGNVLGKAIQTPVIVEKLHFESAVTSEVKGSCDVSMNLLAAGGSTQVFPTSPGAIVYPAAA